MHAYRQIYTPKLLATTCVGRSNTATGSAELAMTKCHKHQQGHNIIIAPCSKSLKKL